ncbi:hypothetical protein FJU30_14155 [Affinibrenneria salicis]|uniref:N-acetyl sugar amidotransferase n=1 Tax=Affinibrenneria salicis TaxID=2590031 RepID=A0A5J5FZ15_9GAMM|nr:hypothetical protein [Affinibrenneria salicis]KAA8999470.1 hypothetical protein FJU30_14155 [Affinibrenneria salicis]
MYCKSCVITENFPGADFNDNGECAICRKYKIDLKNKIDTDESKLLENENELRDKLELFKRNGSQYDVLVCLSGGVDSSNTLIEIVRKYNLKPLCFHNDHGFEEEVATENVRKLCASLGVDLIIWQNDHNFMKKLWKTFAESSCNDLSGCYVCGNIIYLNAIQIADNFHIPLVINGYSKGQAEMINNKERGALLLSKMVNVIHESKDDVFIDHFMKKFDVMKKHMIIKNKKDFDNLDLANKIYLLPFYSFKFNKTDKEILRKICIKQFDWKPLNTSFPNRTTNCKMVWLNTFIDLQKNGYTMYNEEYSTLIRKGEITRSKAVSDLDFQPPAGIIESLAGEIGLDLEGKPWEKEKTTSKTPVNKLTQSDEKFDFDF